MTDVRQQQEVTVSLVDDTAFGANMEMPYMDDNSSAETPSSNAEPGVPRRTGYLTNEIAEFIPGVRRYYTNIFGEELYADTEEWFRQSLPLWNTFLQSEQDVRDTSVIISSDIKADINEFILWQEEQRDEQWTEDDTKWSKAWLPHWNMFLQARAGNNLTAGDISIN